MPHRFRKVSIASIIAAYFTACLQLADRLPNEREQVARLICLQMSLYSPDVSRLWKNSSQSKHGPKKTIVSRGTSSPMRAGAVWGGGNAK